MRLLKPLLTALTALLLSTALSAATQEINGVKVQDTATVGGVKLQLNGAGTRYRGIFKVFVAELYAPKKFTSLEELNTMAGPKRLSLTLLRDGGNGQLPKMLARGFEDNVPKAQMSKLVPGLIRWGSQFHARQLSAGDRIDLDWIPGTGMVSSVKGVVVGESFPEPEFFNAMMAIWLGPVPLDHTLKDTLLGAK